MSGWSFVLLAVACCLSGGFAVGIGVLVRAEKRRKAERRAAALGLDSSASRKKQAFLSNAWGMEYCEELTKRLFIGSTEPLAPSVKREGAVATRAGSRFKEIAASAGCAKKVTVAAFCEARLRLGVAGALVGALLGIFLSTPIAVLFGAIGALFGCSVPMRAVKAARRERAFYAERHLSEMLEVVSLGLRSGLTFDRSFALYGSHFDNVFAQSCSRAYRCWALGLMTREESLRDLAASYDCDQLSRIVDSVIRGLRFGSALNGFLEDAAEQSRASYRAALEERVAKAPVKMMLPTGTLILPAMLLMVMGPVLLEVAGGF